MDLCSRHFTSPRATSLGIGAVWGVGSGEVGEWGVLTLKLGMSVNPAKEAVAITYKQANQLIVYRLRHLLDMIEITCIA